MSNNTMFKMRFAVFMLAAALFTGSIAAFVLGNPGACLLVSVALLALVLIPPRWFDYRHAGKDVLAK